MYLELGAKGGQGFGAGLSSSGEASHEYLPPDATERTPSLTFTAEAWSGSLALTFVGYK